MCLKQPFSYLIVFIIVLYQTKPLFSQVSSGPRSATVSANDASVGNVSPWQNMTNAYSQSDTYASFTSVSKNKTTSYLKLTDFGFSGIPASATILGVQVEIDCYAPSSNSGAVYFETIRLIDGSSTLVGTNKGDGTTAWTETTDTDTYTVFGAANDDWSAGLLGSDINSVNFGIAINVKTQNTGGGGANYDFYIDHVRITVTYATGYTATGGVWNSAASWGGSGIPASTDIANIPAGITVTIPSGYTANAVKVVMNSNNSTSASTLTFTNSTSSLAVTGNFEMQGGNANTTSNVNMTGGTLTVGGDLILTGEKNGGNRYNQTITLAGGTLTVTGNTTLTANGASATIDMTGGGSLSFGGTLTNNGTISNGGASPVGTIMYTGTAQTIDNSVTYNNLTLSGSGVKTMGGNFTVNGTLSLQGTATFALGGRTLTYGTNSIIEYKGSTSQTSGNELKTTVETIVIDNVNGVDFSTNTTVNDGITLTNGKLNLGTTTLTLAATAALSGAISTKYIIATGGGVLRKNWTTAGSFTYPIGDASDYVPIDLVFNSGTFGGGAYVEASTTAAKHGSNTSTTHYINRYWTLTQNAVTSPDYNYSMTYVDGDIAGGATESNIYAGKYNGSWELNNPVNAASNLLSGTNITSFSDYTGGEGGALPIELVSFKAEMINYVVHLTWSTATEVNNHFFTIEKSQDGKLFEFVTRLEGAGNSSIVKDYSAKDTAPMEGVSYYRLKQTDFDGTFTYSHLVSITNNANFNTADDPAFVVFPNPSDGANINIKSLTEYQPWEEVSVFVTDLNGREFFSKIIITNEAGSFYTAIDPYEKIPKGVYVVLGSSFSRIYSQILIVE